MINFYKKTNPKTSDKGEIPSKQEHWQSTELILYIVLCPIKPNQYIGLADMGLSPMHWDQLMLLILAKMLSEHHYFSPLLCKCTYWLGAWSLMASLRASKHWSLASLMAPQLLLMVTIVMEQLNNSESNCHFSSKLSPAHGHQQRRQESASQQQ